MVVESKVTSLSRKGTLADDIAYLKDCRISFFVEEGGSLVSGHGDVVGDEFDLWPSSITCNPDDGSEGWVINPRDDSSIFAQHNAQWWANATGMFLVSKSSNETYGPDWIENVPNLEYGKGEPGDVYLPSQPGIVFIYGEDDHDASDYEPSYVQ